MDYANGKIYKITGSGLTYYGSTTQLLSKRMYHHTHALICSSKQIIELGNYDICLVELFPCKSKEELHMRERFYIENNECVNKRVPTQTLKQYREKHKEKMTEYREKHKTHINEQQKEYEKIHKEQRKIYYEKNKEKILKRQKEYNLKKKERCNTNYGEIKIV